MGIRVQPKSSRLASIGLVVGSILLSVLAVEVVARVMGVEPGSFAPKGIATRTVDGVALWDTAYSRYDDEDVRRISAGRDGFKILGLGDSILYGVSLEKKQTYLERMRMGLAGRVKRRIDVLNLAVPGYNTMQELVAYKEVADRIKPDLVIVHYWADDDQQYRVVGGYVVDLGDIPEEEGRLLVQPLPLPAFMNDFLLHYSRPYALLGRVRAAKQRQSLPEDWTRVSTPLAEIHERVESSGGRLLVLASPELDGGTPRSNDDVPRLREFATARGIEVIDLADWMTDVASREIALDGCHFNARGHELLGQQLAEYLRLRDLKDSLD